MSRPALYSFHDDQYGAVDPELLLTGDETGTIKLFGRVLLTGTSIIPFCIRDYCAPLKTARRATATPFSSPFISECIVWGFPLKKTLTSSRVAIWEVCGYVQYCDMTEDIDTQKVLTNAHNLVRKQVGEARDNGENYYWYDLHDYRTLSV